jgi:ferredoxin
VRVDVNKDVCGGHGDCVLVAPGVFDFGDDDDVVSVQIAEPPEDVWDKVREAVDLCPTQAISIVG